MKGTELVAHDLGHDHRPVGPVRVVGRHRAGTQVTAALGYTGFALAPGLWLVLAVAVLPGVAAGMMDAGLNTAVALTGRQRLLNLLHGAYGVGTA